MDVPFSGILILLIEVCYAQYTVKTKRSKALSWNGELDNNTSPLLTSSFAYFTTLLMLPNTVTQDPYVTWQATGSGYNSATNKTVSDLAASSTSGYRNTMIDNWGTVLPDLIRVCYRNDLGHALFCMSFNSTGSTSTGWLGVGRMTSCSNCVTCTTTGETFTSYSSSLPCYSISTGVRRYHAATLLLPGGTFAYVVATGTNPLILPVVAVEECHMSWAGGGGAAVAPFSYNQTVTNLHRLYCSAMCRENNELFGAPHISICSCISALPTTASTTDCTYPCDGDNTETCGGPTPGGFPADVIIFNLVNTDVDTSQFNTPVTIYSTTTLTSTTAEIPFTSVHFLTGYDVTVTGSPTFPVTVTMTMKHVTSTCANADFSLAESQSKTFTVPDGNSVSVDVSVTRVRCVQLTLSVSDGAGDAVTTDMTWASKVVADDQFVTADYISIEAAWATVNDSCECDCFVYNLLYGDSPYDNLTYEEIEIAMKDITDKIKRELSVNVSTLSSTIRKKTSAEDERVSATAVGYGLGVAMLSITFGGLFISDLSRIFVSFNMLKENVGSRFGFDAGQTSGSGGHVTEPSGRRYSTLNNSWTPSPVPKPTPSPKPT